MGLIHGKCSLTIPNRPIVTKRVTVKKGGKKKTKKHKKIEKRKETSCNKKVELLLPKKAVNSYHLEIY